MHSVRSLDTTPAFERDTAVRAARVIAAEQAELIAAGVARERISVVPHGIDVDHFTQEGDRVPVGRRYRLVAVGEVTADSGFATAVAALPGLPDTELVVAGTPQHGGHARELRDYAQRLEVSDRLQLHGPVTRAVLPSLLRSAHLVLCTPWRPRFGMTALEASACGVAVVANETGGLADTIVHRVTGTNAGQAPRSWRPNRVFGRRYVALDEIRRGSADWSSATRSRRPSRNADRAGSAAAPGTAPPAARRGRPGSRGRSRCGGRP
ncbi:glycosyl transferase family 1 [Actinophytocola oryzae]|uniref:Glycosyl transferase family 1 n=1 Tax=Actinophytocola oryzae TaxID=502181 RepID=A0A4R7W6M8_9PSEU|nr:glycosyl transferase family 1 [Actinophytocola oryzae]